MTIAGTTPTGHVGSRVVQLLVQAGVGMAAGLREDFTAEQPRGILTTTPTTLDAWAYAVLRPLVS